uniref:Uncharacterized protein n=2 Tax=Palpitomonas bilix TaxID=652834 RepID=A0A7S3D4F1_9EUKA
MKFCEPTTVRCRVGLHYKTDFEAENIFGFQDALAFVESAVAQGPEGPEENSMTERLLLVLDKPTRAEVKSISVKLGCSIHTVLEMVDAENCKVGSIMNHHLPHSVEIQGSR